MIKNKHDLMEYLEADKKALRRNRRRPSISDYIWKYQILLRKCEYYNNTNRRWSPMFYLLRYKRSKLGLMCGFSIPLNVVGKGLSLVHTGTIIISEYARLGDYCRIHAGVNIGADARIHDKAPMIGNGVYIGPGAKIFGEVSIADNIAIGANAVVTRSFLESNISIAGIPAKKISDTGSEGIIIY